LASCGFRVALSLGRWFDVGEALTKSQVTPEIEPREVQERTALRHSMPEFEAVKQEKATRNSWRHPGQTTRADTGFEESATKVRKLALRDEKTAPSAETSKNLKGRRARKQRSAPARL
jgi:hypothetical protein